MNRLYVVEPSLTRDRHERRSPPAPAGAGDRAATCKALARRARRSRRVARRARPAQRGTARPTRRPAETWITGRRQGPGRATRARRLVIAGSRQPAAVHALAHAINHALGNAGRTVHYVAPRSTPSERDPFADITRARRATWRRAASRRCSILGGNPVYDAPADLEFADALAKVDDQHLPVEPPATRPRRSAPGTCRAPTTSRAGATSRARDGTYAIQQPLIAPLFGGRSDIELLARSPARPKLSAATHIGARPRPRRTRRTATSSRGRRRCSAASARRSERARSAVRARRCRTRRWPRRCARCRKPPRSAASDARGHVPRRHQAVSTAATRTTPGCSSCPIRSRASPGTTPRCIAPRTAKALGIKNGDMVSIEHARPATRSRSWPGCSPARPTNTIGAARSAGAARAAGRYGNGRGLRRLPAAHERRRPHFGVGRRSSTKLGTTLPALADAGARRDGGPPARARRDARRVQGSSPNFAAVRARPTRPRRRCGRRRTTTRATQWGMAIDLNALHRLQRLRRSPARPRTTSRSSARSRSRAAARCTGSASTATSSATPRTTRRSRSSRSPASSARTRRARTSARSPRPRTAPKA